MRAGQGSGWAIARSAAASALVLAALAGAAGAQPRPAAGRATISVSPLEPAAAQAFGAMGDGVADLLAASLARSERFLVLERGAAGFARADAPAEPLVGPDLVVTGAITELESALVEVTVGRAGARPAPAGAAVGLAVRVIDARTGNLVLAARGQGKADDASAIPDTGPLGAGLDGVAGTPLDKALRLAVQEAARAIVTQTPTAYFSHTGLVSRARPAMPVIAAAPPEVPPAPVRPRAEPPPRPAPAPAPVSPAPSRRVKSPTANLRDQPAVRGKIVVVLKQGARLVVLEDRSQWLRVRTEDGKEGWIASSVLAPLP
jgi:curli biogenesis system outer membrane secretion channel CsgG